MNFTTARKASMALVPAVFCLYSHLIASSSFSQETLHILMAADTEDGFIGNDCQTDLNRLKSFFAEPTNVPPNKKVKVTFLTSAPTQGALRFSHNAILDHYKALQQNKEFNPKTDTILFYYSGHGFYDREKGHFMKTPGQLLLRTELREAVLKCQPRLAVIITDCCQQVKPLAAITVRGLVDNRADIVDSLFFKPVGLVDINACSQGQFAAGGSPNAGGFFTKALFDLMSLSFIQVQELSPSHGLLKNDMVLTWREFFPLLMSKTMENWKEGYAKDDGCTDNVDLPGGTQCTQDPQAYSLPTQTPFDPPGFKHGLTLAVFQKDGKDAGLMVTSVQPGSPADIAGLKKDDVILEIDNKRILSAVECDCAINFAPVSGSIHVKYDRAGKSGDAKITLERDK